MKTNRNFLNIALVTIGLALPQLAFAQKLNISNSNIKISGTSTMHDWTMTAKVGSFAGEAHDTNINNVKFVVPYKNIVSTKGKMMDNKAHSALKEKDITFSANQIPVGTNKPVTGQLTIAGVTKNVTIPVTTVKKGNVYVISGEQKIKMSDYKMEKPGMIGMKAGDEVKVNVTIEAQ